MPIKNRIQREFKKQITEAEKEALQKATKGEGAFTNRLFKLRFYGYRNKTKHNNKIITFCTKLITIVIRITISILTLIGIITTFIIILTIINALKYTN